MAQTQVAGHALAAQIQVAVLEPQLASDARSSPAAGSAGLGGVTALPGLEAAEASADGGCAVMCCGCALKPAVAPLAEFARSA
jgi:hypothetical protein